MTPARKLAGLSRHEELFFKENGEPIRNLQYPYVRWRRMLTLTLKDRYREPYDARHSSVSWNLMIGKNPLWVAKQHGHSVQTMLETYAACTEGAKESDIEAIKQAMNAAPRVVARAANSSEVVAVYQVSAAPPIIKVVEAENATNPQRPQEFATNLPPARAAKGIISDATDTLEETAHLAQSHRGFRQADVSIAAQLMPRSRISMGTAICSALRPLSL